MKIKAISEYKSANFLFSSVLFQPDASCYLYVCLRLGMSYVHILSIK